MQLAGMGIGALLLIVGVIVLVMHLTHREVQAEEPVAELQAAGGEGAALEPFSEMTASADQALEEQEPEDDTEHPDMFYEGYRFIRMLRPKRSGARISHQRTAYWWI